MSRRYRRDWVPLVLAILALTLSTAPYLWGASRTPPGWKFWWAPPINAGDANQYLAFTRRVASGGPQGNWNWWVGDPFTSEPHTPRLLLPQIHFQAALVRLGASVEGAFQVSRVLGGAALLAAAWWFGTVFLARRSLRRIYFAVVCFGAGLGWLTDLLGFPSTTGDHFQPESNTLFTLGNLPHLGLSAALLTGMLAAAGRLCRPLGNPGRIGLLASLGGMSLILSWTHPFDYLPFLLALAPALGWMAWRGALPIWPAAALLTALAAAAPAGLYLIWLTRTDPIYRALANDALRVQPFWYYAVQHAALAVWLPGVLVKSRDRGRLLIPLCWVLGAFLFLLLPLPLGGKQARVIGGVHAPLALLATLGFHRLTSRFGAHQGWLVAGFLLVQGIGGLALLSRQAAAYTAEPAFYHSPSLQGALRFLDQEGRAGELALGGAWTGGWLPTYTPLTSHVGHWHMTLDGRRKNEDRRKFFLEPGISPQARADWLRREGIRWILWCPWEWGQRTLLLDSVPGVRRVFQGEDCLVYRFSG